MDKDDLTVEMIVNYIAKVLQSNKKLTLDDKLIFTTSVIKIPRGSGKRLNDFIFKKQSIVQVKVDDDQLCGLRAIIISKTLADKDFIKYDSLRDKRNNMQTIESRLLAQKLNFDINHPISLNEIKK